MTSTKMPLRLWLATLIAFAASRIAPLEMRPFFACYCEMLADFNDQFRMGRTFGVVTACWSGTEVGMLTARRMQIRAIAALHEERCDLADARNAGDV